MQFGRPEKERNNLEAQLNKLKQNLSNIVNQTHEAVSIKEGYLLEIANLEDELLVKREELQQVVLSMDTTKKSVNDSKAALDKLEKLIQTATQSGQEKIRKIDQEVNKAMGELRDILRKIDQKSINHESLVENHKSEIKKYQKEESDAKLQAEKAEEVLEDIKSRIEEALNVLDDTYVYTDEVTKGLNQRQSAIELREKELIELGSQLSDREEAVARKEADLKVYENRVAKQYTEAFPNRKLILT